MSVNKAEQGILPGMQQPLGIQRELETIPAADVENLGETQRVYGIPEVKSLMINLGLATTETADETLKGWRRKNSFRFSSDAFTAAYHMFVTIWLNKELQTKFEEVYLEPYSDDAFHRALGGGKVDKDNCDVTRTPEDRSADEEAILDFLAKRDPRDDLFVNEEWIPKLNARRRKDRLKNMEIGEVEYGPSGERYVFDGAQLQLQPKN